jgi:hypothetical protein
MAVGIMGNVTRPSNARTRTLLALVAVAVGSMLLLVPSAGAAAAHSSSAYSAQAVLKAFTSRGVKLYNTGVGYSSPVTTLASVKPHDGWNVGIYIYTSQKTAASAYNANVKSWLKSGMAARLVKNVVIAVVPKGVTLGKRKAKPWPMPAVVLSAIAAFTKR